MTRGRFLRSPRAWLGALCLELALAGCGDGTVGGDPASGGGNAGGATSSGGAGPGATGTSSSAGGTGQGGSGTGGDAGDGGGGGGGIKPDVPDAPLPPYGTQTMQVSANITHFHTGLSLAAGQTVTIAATGAWNLFGTDYGPGGDAGQIEHGCPLGSLVARFGLHWKGDITTPQAYPFCVGEGAVITADQPGILFLSHNFTHGYEPEHSGALEVEVTSDGPRSPIIPAEHLHAWNLAFVSSEWIELRGQGVYLTVPRALAEKHQATAPAAVAAFDAWYAAEAELSGAKPYAGEPIRFYPDENIGPFAYGLAGNPIRYVHHAMDSDAPYANVLRAGEKSHSAWVWVHEMGHDFTFINAGYATYMVDGGGVEGWANVPGIYALEKAGFPEGAARRPHDRAETCDDIVPPYVAGGSYAQFKGDPWLNLCLVLELKDAHGWELIRKFLSWYNGVPQSEISHLFTADEATRWTWLRDKMNEFAGQDTTAVFQKYKVPLK